MASWPVAGLVRHVLELYSFHLQACYPIPKRIMIAEQLYVNASGRLWPVSKRIVLLGPMFLPCVYLPMCPLISRWLNSLSEAGRLVGRIGIDAWHQGACFRSLAA